MGRLVVEAEAGNFSSFLSSALADYADHHSITPDVNGNGKYDAGIDAPLRRPGIIVDLRMIGARSRSSRRNADLLINSTSADVNGSFVIGATVISGTTYSVGPRCGEQALVAAGDDALVTSSGMNMVAGPAGSSTTIGITKRPSSSSASRPATRAIVSSSATRSIDGTKETTTQTSAANPVGSTSTSKTATMASTTKTATMASTTKTATKTSTTLLRSTTKTSSGTKTSTSRSASEVSFGSAVFHVRSHLFHASPQTATRTTTSETAASKTTTLATVSWTAYLANATLPPISNPYIQFNVSRVLSTASVNENKTAGYQFETPASGGPFSVDRMHLKLATPSAYKGSPIELTVTFRRSLLALGQNLTNYTTFDTESEVIAAIKVNGLTINITQALPINFIVSFAIPPVSLLAGNSYFVGVTYVNPTDKLAIAYGTCPTAYLPGGWTIYRCMASRLFGSQAPGIGFGLG